MLLHFKYWDLIYNRFVFSIKRIVSSMIILFTLTSKSGFPKRSKLQSELESMLETLNSRMSSRWPKRSCRILSYKGQCRRKCSLSSFACPQSQIGLTQSKLCRNIFECKVCTQVLLIQKYTIWSITFFKIRDPKSLDFSSSILWLPLLTSELYHNAKIFSAWPGSSQKRYSSFEIEI